MLFVWNQKLWGRFDKNGTFEEIHLRGPFRKSHNSDRKITKIQRLGRLLLLSIQVRDFKASQVFLKKTGDVIWLHRKFQWDQMLEYTVAQIFAENDVFKSSAQSRLIFGLFLCENLSPITFKNRHIWSH